MKMKTSRMLASVVLASGAWGQATPPANFPWAALDPHAIVLPGVESSVYKQRYGLNVAGQVVSRTRAEREGTTSDWFSETGEFSVAYFITCWTGREGGDEIYLCGLKSTSETIIERWTFPVPNRRWVVRYPSQTPAIGTPAASYDPVIEVKGGGTWRWSASHVRQVPSTQPSGSPQITPIYEGPAGPFTSMTVDPEGRQLILYDFTSHAIVRLRLSGTGATFEPLYTVQDHPQLSQVASLDVRDFGSEGRKLLGRKQYAQTFVGSAEVYTIASDPNNDGNFDQITFMDRPTFDASAYRTWTNWREFWRVDD